MDRAIDLTKEQSASLTAMSVVYTNDEYLALAPGIVGDLISKAKDKLATIDRKAKEAGVEINTLVKEGEAFEAITSFALDSNIVITSYSIHYTKLYDP